MKLLLIDGNSVLFRGYYATAYGNVMKTRAGIYTNAVFAFANMLFKAIDMLKPTHIAVAFDKGKHTFRHELNKDYKAGRQKTPDELASQFALVREFLRACHIPYYEFDNIEADDIVGTLSKMFPGVETEILTGDRDLLQLIDDATVVNRMVKGISEMERLDVAGLREKYGLRPDQIIDLKGLMGDASDNIKGVRGIGPKTAETLLKKYDTCEGVYAHLAELKGKIRENLENDRESCFLSKTLATIKTDVVMDVKLADLFMDIHWEEANSFFLEYDMHSLIRHALVPSDKTAKRSMVKKVKKISAAIYGKCPYIHFDSNEFSYYRRQLFGLCFCDGKHCEYISLSDLQKDKNCIAFLADSAKKKICYDSKAAMHCAAYNGFSLAGAEDLQLAGFLINNYNIDFATLAHYFSQEAPEPISLFYGSEKKEKEIQPERQVQFAGTYARSGYDLFHCCQKELQEKELCSLYEEIEKPLAEVLYAMEKEGICCDKNILEDIANETKAKMEEAAQQIYDYVGHPFNLNSPKQLAEVLFDELGLPTGKKRSTSADVLEYLTDFHPIVAIISVYRKQAKIYSTYAEGLKKYIEEDGKIHTIFAQTSTQTGRLSSLEPNLQNITVRDEEGRNIRKAFLPSPGHVLMDSDYSQIELRVLASLAREERMIHAFQNHIDIHTQTAADIFKVAVDEVTPELRRRAKAVNFGIVYGISDFGLAKQVGLSRKEAAAFISNYYKTYPRIHEYLQKEIAFCEKNGYVKTMFGRRRYIREIYDKNYNIREFGKRAAMNAPIQGSAADLMKIAMVRCFRAMKEKGLAAKMILQIHDELIFDVPENEIEIMKEVIRVGMNEALDLATGLQSSLGVATSWYEAK